MIFVSHFLILVYKGGKWLQNNRKNAIFQNWLDTRPKMETHEPMSIPSFWGCFARFLESVLRCGRSKYHFLALENGHFCLMSNVIQADGSYLVLDVSTHSSENDLGFQIETGITSG